MSIIFALALASASVAPVEPPCSWDHPGRNPYRGSISAAIDRYTDIPPEIARTLKRRMAEHQPDDKVIITRDAISGREQYETQIRDMHFGAASVCHSVSRAGWSTIRREPASVYCVGSVCILVPRICGNISRITRIEAPPHSSADHAGAAPSQAPAGTTAVAPIRRTAAGAPTPAAALAATLHPVLPPVADATPPASLPIFEISEPAAPATVSTADPDSSGRNRLPGRTPATWQTIDAAWHNPGRDGGAGGAGGGGAGGSNGGSSPSPVPEPSAGLMQLAGLASLALRQRLRRRSQQT